MMYFSYLPELTLSDYHLFQSLQHYIDGTIFHVPDDVYHNVEFYLNSKPKNVSRMILKSCLENEEIF